METKVSSVYGRRKWCLLLTTASDDFERSSGRSVLAQFQAMNLKDKIPSKEVVKRFFLSAASRMANFVRSSMPSCFLLNEVCAKT